jgi:hypothetical protein
MMAHQADDIAALVQQQHAAAGCCHHFASWRMLVPLLLKIPAATAAGMCSAAEAVTWQLPVILTCRLE